MHKSKKKLALTAESIRVLGEQQLRRASGGQSVAGCSAHCSQDICPHTLFAEGCNGGSAKCPGSVECPSELCSVNAC